MGDTVVLSYGMGVDSTAILLRWLDDPASRDFYLEQLVVVTAMTGDEFSDTGRLVTQHILPRLTSAGVRFVQIARAGPRDADGITVLDDTRAPAVLHLGGAYKLSDELRAGGTVAQVAAGRRTCSIKFKGTVLDRWIEANVSGTFRHVMGFNADELTRATRDTSYSTELRSSEYPLIEWGWGRDECETYIAGLVAEPWSKSCCTHCPFAGSASGLPSHLERWREHPDEAIEALLLEHVSLALNPNVALFGKRRAIDEVDEHLRTVFLAHVSRLEHTIYEVRRILLPRKADPTKKAPGWRSIRSTGGGDRDILAGQLIVDHGGPVDSSDHVTRIWHRRRGVLLPTVEHMHVVAPIGAIDKARVGFEALWTKHATGQQSDVA